MSKLNDKLPSKRIRALSCSKLKIIRNNSVTDLLNDENDKKMNKNFIKKS